MLSKLTFHWKFFFWGLLTGISINNPILLPFFVFGFYKFIYHIQKMHSLSSGFQFGWLFGFGFFLSSMYWIINPFLIYEKHYFLAPFVIILFPFLLGIFFGIASFLILFFLSINKINESNQRFAGGGTFRSGCVVKLCTGESMGGATSATEGKQLSPSPNHVQA